MSALDALYERLSINNPSKQSTCIGYGQRKPTCGIAVAQASRDTARGILKQVLADIRASRQVQDDDLQEIASLLLCRRYHQFQADENVENWRDALHDWIPPARPSSSRRLTHEPRPHSPVITDLQSASDQAFIDEFKRRLENNPSFNFVSDVINSTAALHGRVNALHTNTPTPARGTQEMREQNSPATNSSHSSNNGQVTSHTRGHQARSPSSELPTQRRAQGTSTSSTSTPRSRASVRAELPINAVASNQRTELPAPPEPLRHSHTECGICYEPYEEQNSDEHWECNNCHNRTHQDCFQSWRDSNHGPVLRCIYCRATV